MRQLTRILTIGVALVPLVTTTSSSVYAQGPGGPGGADILIRAENRSTADTPFCGVGGGQVGDRLRVDAFMNMDGEVTGRAVFEDANGVTDEHQDRSNVQRWSDGSGHARAEPDQSEHGRDLDKRLSADVQLSTALVNVELPRGCGTRSPRSRRVSTRSRWRSSSANVQSRRPWPCRETTPAGGR